LCDKHARKDDDGIAIIIDRNYLIDDMDAFEVELLSIKETYADVIKEQEEKDALLKDFLTEKITYELYQISPDDIPDGISASDLNSIETIIADN
jgi:hypothetical protein